VNQINADLARGFWRRPHDYTRETWSRKFEILEIIPDLLGNLDVAVMRLRS